MIQENLKFDSLVQSCRLSLTRVAYHLCGNQEAAYDIVQETLIDAYRGFHGLREQAKAKSWLYAILRKKAINYQRSQKSEIEFSEDYMAAVQDDGESMARMIFTEQLSRLNAQDREILAGKYLLGLSYKELAESIGIKEGAVRVRCLRAKERLGEILRGVGVNVPEKR